MSGIDMEADRFNPACQYTDDGYPEAYAFKHPEGQFVRFTDYAALREKLEAAEGSLRQCVEFVEKVIRQRDAAEAALTEARAGQAAAWEAGREAQIKAYDASCSMRDGDMPYAQALKIIQASTTPPADLSTALQRVRDEVWNEAIEAAAMVIITGKEVQDPMDDEPSTVMVDHADHNEAAAAIRALRHAAPKGDQ